MGEQENPHLILLAMVNKCSSGYEISICDLTFALGELG